MNKKIKYTIAPLIACFFETCSKSFGSLGHCILTKLGPLDTWAFRHLGTCVAGLLVFGFLGISGISAGDAAPPVSPALIPLAPLQAELTALNASKQSSTSKRRACKGVIRDAQALIESQPEAANRFPVLALILKAQQRLLGMDNNQRNRDAFFKTCAALAKAPGAYSAYRLNAEMMLSERDLSARDADAEERTKVLTEMVQRYRNTPGEVESLMAAIRVATKLGAYELKEQLVKDLSERFAGSPTAIAYRRKLIGASRMDIVFTGTFEGFNGTSISFPFDRLGYPYLAIFWSKDAPMALEKLKQLKEQQEQAPDAFEIYSFNLDQLPDGGNSIIKSVGLKCTVLRLPGGRQSETFLTYALHDPAALRVNQFGHAIVPPSQSVHFKNQEEAKKFAHSTVYDEFAYQAAGRMIDLNQYDRHLSQIQSLLIGDLLVAGGEWPSFAKATAGKQVANGEGTGTASPLASELKAIQECFVAPPLRYRLTGSDALAHYKRANELCIKAITTHPKASDLWKVRNYRMIALMGMASISGSQDYFQEAIKEARTTVAVNLPEEAGVVARFCLAKEALRDGSESARDIVNAFITHCGGEKAGLKACSAACVLAIHADSRELYQQYRSKILKSPNQTQALASFSSFLCNRYHQYYLFKGNPNYYLYSREYRFTERRYMIDDGLAPMMQPLPPLQLKTLDGKTVSLPNKKSDVLTLLLFVEPPANGSNELASEIYAPAVPTIKKKKNPQPSGLLASANALDGQNINNGLQCITIFLSDDVARVKAIRDKYSLSSLITVLPGGLKNPIVNQLGILSADRNVNSFLVRRDGTIAWSKNGLPYQMSGLLSYISTIGWNVQINVCDSEAGYRALKEKDYKKALHLFSGTYLKKGGVDDSTLTAALLQARSESDSKWKSSRFHGSALAHIGLKDYEAALVDIDHAISWHLRRNQFNHDPEKPCSTMTYMQTTRSKILDGLGRSSEAREARNKAALKPTDYPTYYSRIRGFNKPYEAFENRLSIVAKEIK